MKPRSPTLSPLAVGLSALPVAVVYFASAIATVTFTRFDGGVAFIWAAGGVLLGALLAADRGHWPALIGTCWLASCVATAFFGLGSSAALPLAFVNVTEAALAAWLLRRLLPDFGALKSVGEVSLLLVVAGLAVPAASAVPGAAVAAAVANVRFWPNWWAWFAGHALGAVTITPLVLLYLRGEIGGWVRQASARQLGEAVLLLALVAIVTIAVFTQTRFPLLFLPLLPMMVAVFRLGRLGAAASLILMGAIGGVLTLRGLGPITLIQGGSGLRAQFLQLYLATATLMVLPAAGELKRRKETLEALEEQAVLHRLILDRTGDMIMTLELEGRIRFVSPSSTRLIGLEPAALIGTMPQAIIHAEDIDRVVAVHREVLREPDRTFTVDYRVVVGSTEVGWFETHARAMLDESGQPSGAVVIVRDITGRKTSELRLTDAAMTDPLTGIANRRAFDAALASRLSSSGSAVLAMFDLDHFKRINDAHGHAAGDLVLRSFADVLQRCVRTGDLVARSGGEEFAAIIQGDLDAARLVCERVRAQTAATALEVCVGASLTVTVSTGIAPFPAGGSSEEVLAAADAALYRAKAEGRNRLSLAVAPDDNTLAFIETVRRSPGS